MNTKGKRPRASAGVQRRPQASTGVRVIAFGGQKGGAGKTTTAICVAVELHARGRNVLVVDTDPQASARTWKAHAVDQGVAGPTVVAMGEGLHHPDQLPKLAAMYDVTLVDCPPRLDEVQRSALMVADLVVLPCGPSVMDVWALTEAMELVQKARRLRAALGAAVLITRRQPRTKVGEEVREALRGIELPVFRAELAYRVAYQTALGAGMGPTTYEPRGEAAAEVRALVDELERWRP